MAVLLLILKIIGIVLLSILALILIVFFVPVSYKACFNQDEEFRAEAVISYLLHAVSVHIVKEADFDVYIRILGIRLRKSKKAGQGHKGHKKDTDSKEDQPTVKEEADKKVLSEDKEAKNKKFDLSNIEKYIDFLNEESTKNAFKTCCRRLGKLLKMVAPKKFKAEVTYGLEDPSITGKILAIYNILYIYFDKHLILYPVYDDKIIRSKGYMKGRIFAAAVLFQLVLVVLDKDCRKFYKEVRNL